MSKDYPVPPTPLTNILSSCKEQEHWPGSFLIWWSKCALILTKIHLWSLFSIVILSSRVTSS